MSAANCSVVPTAVRSDSGIAGAGVLLSFIITAGIALIISTALILQDAFTSRKSHNRDSLTKLHRAVPPSLPAAVCRKLLNSYSDQQIVTGIGIQSVGLAQIDTLVPYHFFLIWMLGLLSTAVHNAALLALVHDFRRDWVLRWLRQFLMFANLALSCVYGVIVLQGLAKGWRQTLPVGCIWVESGSVSSATASTNSTETDAAVFSGSSTGTAFHYIATVAAIAGNCIVFGLATWYLHSRGQRFYRAVQVGGLVLMMAVAIGSTVRIVLLSQAFGKPSVALSDRGETQWSFGQLVTLLVLALPMISIIEIVRGEIKVAPPVQDDGTDSDSDRLPLRSVVRNSFQPNPFFGARRTYSN